MYVNLFIKYLEVGLLDEDISKESVQVQGAKLFSVSYPYKFLISGGLGLGKSTR